MKTMIREMWNQSNTLLDLFFTKVNGHLIEQTVIQYYLNHIQSLIPKDDISFEPETTP